MGGIKLTDDGHLEKLTVADRAEFVAVLRDWSAKSDAETVGDVGNAGIRPVIVVPLTDGRMARLHADTKHSAVIEFLRFVDRHGVDAPMWVVANRNGNFNKITFADGGEPTPGWFFYLVEPATGPEEI